MLQQFLWASGRLAADASVTGPTLAMPCLDGVDGSVVGSTGQQLDEVPTCRGYRTVFVH